MRSMAVNNLNEKLTTNKNISISSSCSLYRLSINRNLLNPIKLAYPNVAQQN